MYDTSATGLVALVVLGLDLFFRILGEELHLHHAACISSS